MVPVSYSTYGFTQTAYESVFDRIAEAGFRHVEFACDRHGIEKDPLAQAAAILRALQDRNLSATTVHAPARTNVLGGVTEEWRTTAVAVLADAVRLTGEIGASGLVIHGIPNPMFLPQDRNIKSFYTPMIEAMRQSVTELVPVAEQAGVRLLLENLPYNRDLRVAGQDADYPLMHVEDLREFIDPFPDDQVGLIVDVGHSWTNGRDPAAEILAAGDRLWGTHLQDVDHDDPRDDHWAPLQGGLDWNSILGALEQVQYAGTYTFEIIRPRHDESPEDLARLTIEAARSWGLTSSATD
ncbi:MAG: sugar phosphate isomerase/epimerase family protein [Planctomycetota bacterium]|nr:sugar phosphate isomerase/epimerase family protein [Planctomycetota bacterium]MEE3364501.1 sugar phosphate isomerase/epimerase family protein [Planctomycetota bacterium]